MALRTAVHSVTGFSPFFLNYMREFTYSGSDYKLHTIEDETDVDPISDRTKFLEEFPKLLDDVTRRMKASYERNNVYYDKGKIDKSFEIGDTVYRRNFTKSDASKEYSAKLGKLYLESEVVGKVLDVAYFLKDKRTGMVKSYHIHDIKPE